MSQNACFWVCIAQNLLILLLFIFGFLYFVLLLRADYIDFWYKLLCCYIEICIHFGCDSFVIVFWERDCSASSNYFADDVLVELGSYIDIIVHSVVFLGALIINSFNKNHLRILLVSALPPVTFSVIFPINTLRTPQHQQHLFRVFQPKTSSQ